MQRAFFATAILAFTPCVTSAAADKKPPPAQTIVVPAPEVTVNIPPVPQPVPVRIEEKESDRSLVKGTWALVWTNMILAGAAVLFGFLQRRDVARSMNLAKESADASQKSADSAHDSVRLIVVQRRESLVREANAAVHRVEIRATWIGQLAGEVKPRLYENWALAGRNVADISAHPYVRAAEEQQQRTEQIKVEAQRLLPVAELPEEGLARALRTLDELQLQLDTMQEAITWRLDALRAEWNVLWARRNREQADDRSLG